MNRFAVQILCASSFLVPPVSGGDELPPVGTAGGPSRALLLVEARSWLAGRTLFAREHGERDGLGAPGFNAQSCAFCHKDPAVGGAGGREVDVLTLRGRSSYDPGDMAGNRLTAMHQLREALERRKGSRPSPFEVRQTPSLLGLGAIDTIPDDVILANEDPEDADGDGVRGMARRVAVKGTTEIGRFGWQAEVPRLADFVCRALGGELGLTAPDQGRGFGLVEDEDRALDPETSQAALDDLDFFVAHLAPPPRGEGGDPERLLRGEQLFEQIGCATCHVPFLCGTGGRVGLYSDLLLHELQPAEKVEPRLQAPLMTLGGAGQGRGIPAGLQLDSGQSAQQGRGPAPAVEHRFRTAPLWGAARTAPYLHDGRAPTLRDAVLAHGVEAERARQRFDALADADQQALLEFVAGL